MHGYKTAVFTKRLVIVVLVTISRMTGIKPEVGDELNDFFSSHQLAQIGFS